MQIIYTTHSKIFINPYSMKNTILLGSNIYEQYSARKKKNINVSETILVDTNQADGYKKICEHLGIDNNTYDILDKNNILVEGECDEKYLKELCAYFSIEAPKFIPMNGVDNCENILKFYESYYSNNKSDLKPKIKILFDNDMAGRMVKNKIEKHIKKKVYRHIDVSINMVYNFNGEKPDGNATNHEIEDFIYPEILCYLVNKFLEKMNLKKVSEKFFLKNFVKNSFTAAGALALLEHEKNDANPNDGNKISFTSSSNATNNFKTAVADMFKILGDSRLVSLMESCKEKYPFVEKYVVELCTFGC